MLIIDDKLISDDVLQKQFVCDLSKCKGACCWEGDFGAPLSAAEEMIIEDTFDEIKEFLHEENLKEIDKKGKTHYYEEPKFTGTALFDDGRCVFMTKNELGISACAFEQAYQKGKTDFKKPISCHLYPVRTKKIEHTAFEALNYDQWSICAAACDQGEKLKIPVFEFVKEAIIRKYGKEFYQQLAAAAKDI